MRGTLDIYPERRDLEHAFSELVKLEQICCELKLMESDTERNYVD